MLPAQLVSVGLAVPLRGPFDYSVPAHLPRPAIGARVRVPFGRRAVVGVVVAHPSQSALDPKQIRPIDAVLDTEPLLDRPLLELLEWAAGYYHQPVGEAVMQAVPAWLRAGHDPSDLRSQWLALTADGQAARMDMAVKKRAPRQAAVLDRLAGGPASAGDLRAAGVTADVLRRLREKRLIESAAAPGAPSRDDPDGLLVRAGNAPALSEDQRAVVESLRAQPAGFAVSLLYGVTGSGKTEVYMRQIEDALGRRQQSLLLVPEIGLTPQVVARLRERFAEDLAVLHSGLGDRERARAWMRARSGEAGLVVGTRSAVFAVMPRLGLIVVDEEHDASFRQQTGFRYSARDLAIVRASRLGIPVVLGSATPSLESLHNARTGRYGWFELPRRIGAARQPRVRIVDLNVHAQRNGLSTPLIEEIQTHLSEHRQVIVFVNRRGFAPTLFCPQCGQCEQCKRCDAHMSIHARDGRLRCHHCGASVALQWSCPQCGTERVAVGAGTQRIEDELQSLFPEHTLARLDRDAASTSDRIDAVLDAVAAGETDILVGTQMLTKGHDFARVTLVGILNADQGLFGTGFRGEERLAQSIIQVAGRAGRREAPGELIVQSYFPAHPLLRELLEHGYLAAAEMLLEARRATGWPPFSAIALISAEAKSRAAAHEFLGEVRRAARPHLGAARLLGPAPAAMERRQGRYRAQLLLQAAERSVLHGALGPIVTAIPALRSTRSVRWAVDVDPLDV